MPSAVRHSVELRSAASRRSTFRSQLHTSTTNSLNVTKEELTNIHDPKSIKFFRERFNNDAENFYKALGTSKALGLDQAVHDQAERIEKYGINKLPEKKPKSFLKLAWEAMHDKVLILLSVAAVISLALGLYETFGQGPEYDAEGNALPKVEWVEGVAIVVAILIVVVVGAANDYQKELQFAKLNAKKTDREIVIIRGGEELMISIFDLMVGDVITLQTGDVLPADCVLVQGSCECDESALTGESHSIHKVPIESALKIYDEKFPNADSDIGVKGVPDSFLISGSKLLSGIGKAVVTAIGPNSIHGRTMASLQVESEVTPLQVRLDNLAGGITKYGILIAVILLIVLTGKFLSYLPEGKKYHDLSSSKKGSKYLDLVITAITLIVVAVPEGLPLAVTLALAFATTRMSKDGNLVRVLRACEIMGGATAVCSDKTGTLTENRMKVVNGNFANLEFDDNTTSEIEKSGDLTLTKDTQLDLFRNITLNSTAFENKDEEEVAENPVVPPKKHFWLSSSKKKKFDDLPPEPFLGSKTETALLELAQRSFGLKNNLTHLRTNPQELGIEEITQVIPFESSRKWGGIVVKLAEGHYRFYIKGAAELVFARCSHRTAPSGEVVKVDDSISQEVNQKIVNYAEMALRTISMAHRDIKVASWPPKNYVTKIPEEADPELILGEPIPLDYQEGLALDGIVGIKDPLRAGVKDAVAQCVRAGVTVRMVTGDNVITAKAISINCGILTEKEKNDEVSCMEGPVFRKLSKDERFAIVPKLKVLARSSPEDKRILVETLKKQGEVVAVTGDGTNDAPALKLADVGFSMGISGTEVAREASDIILMTDDFSAIVDAIKWGRCVSSSIKKFIQFQLTVNVTAVVLTFVSAVSSSEGHSVLTAVQLLWVNLIMDTLAALALATDKPDNYVLDKKPEGRKASIISVSMWKMIIGQSTLQLIVTFILHFGGQDIFYGRPITSTEQKRLDACTFNTFVWLQFFKLWVTRKLDEADGIKRVKDRITLSNLNFFQHLFRNWYFLIIAGIIAGFQVLIMFVGGTAFSVKRQTGAMWAVAIICGLLSLPWGALIRIIPDEWVIKVFPTRVYNVLAYILSFKYLKRSKNKKYYKDSDSESEFENEEKHLLYQKYPAFKKTKEEINYVREGDFNDSSSAFSLNPLSIYQKWRGHIDSHDDDESNVAVPTEHHTIAALTMVPTVVGGAVAGWSPLAGVKSSTKRD